MLVKPDLDDAKIIGCVQQEYGLPVTYVRFLPLGADVNTAVYRVVTDDETPYFLKLRRGIFDQNSVAIPKFLHDQGITPIIAPIATRAQQLWAMMDDFTVILYPFVDGRSGFESDLSERQWIDFGAALKSIHAANIPSSLISELPREMYSPQWREKLKAYQARVEQEPFADATAAALADVLKANQHKVQHIVNQAERLALALQARSPELVLCHADIHAGNVLIEACGAICIVDWDTPIVAPKERDLMFIGGGIGGTLDDAQGSMHFYEGYGQTEIDPIALTYYRYERIVQDIAAYCEQILSTDGGDEDRVQGLHYFKAQFIPNGVIDIANKTAKSLLPEFQYP